MVDKIILNLFRKSRDHISIHFPIKGKYVQERERQTDRQTERERERQEQ